MLNEQFIRKQIKERIDRGGQRFYNFSLWNEWNKCKKMFRRMFFYRACNDY